MQEYRINLIDGHNAIISSSTARGALQQAERFYNPASLPGIKRASTIGYGAAVDAAFANYTREVLSGCQRYVVQERIAITAYKNTGDYRPFRPWQQFTPAGLYSNKYLQNLQAIPFRLPCSSQCTGCQQATGKQQQAWQASQEAA